MSSWDVVLGDSLVVLADLEAGSVDAIVCDPPYGIGFMGREWDAFERRAFQAWCERWARLALRALKPGGFLLAFGGTRTSHRLVCGIEDAGFEIRDSLVWLYGSGFPKSLDVGKAIDAAAGATRAVVGSAITGAAYTRGARRNADEGFEGGQTVRDVTAPATPDAERWQGWGTALKPAHEPIVVARKPLAGTVAANVLAHGTGALNVDGCRIEAQGRPMIESKAEASRHTFGDGLNGSRAAGTTDAGRWPANVVMDPEAAAMLDEQTGELGISRGGSRGAPGIFSGLAPVDEPQGFGDTGGASRFFYCAKASSAERNALDLAYLPRARSVRKRAQQDAADRWRQRARNRHPTVKPVAVMRWLVRLVTPPGALVVDPFAGSGTTGCAATLEGRRFVGIERDRASWIIARARIAWWAEHPDGVELVQRLEREAEREAVAAAGQMGLFEPGATVESAA